MLATLHIQLFGDFRLVFGDEPVTGVNTARLQSLLAYLVLHRAAPQSRQHLAFRFWPDSTESQARNNLRQALHQLRHALPDADRFLSADTTTLCWRSDAAFSLDVSDFTRALATADVAERSADPAAMRAALEQAVSLYRGDLLPSCYDEWIIPERDRLCEQQLKALERLVRILEEQREYATAIPYAQQRLRHDSLDEDSYLRLMRLHALNNDRASALRVYHVCASALQRELGVEPGPATRDAYERLLQIDVMPTARRPALTAASPLIGRQAEWEQLQRAWRRAAGGQAHFALITGEAGIGKSRLAEELLAWVGQQGFTAARTRAYAAEGQLFSPNELLLALEHAEQGIAIYDPQQHHAHVLHYAGHDPGTCCREVASKALWLLGYPDQALKRSQEAISLGKELSHPYSLAHALYNDAVSHVLRREAQAVAEQVKATITIATENDIPQQLAHGMMLQGWALAELGDVEQGIVRMHQGLADWTAMGMVLQRPFYLALLAQAYWRAGQVDNGLMSLSEALAVAHASGERHFEAEIHRLRGDLLLAAGQPADQAESAYHQALQVARQQGTRSLELRAVVSLSRLWQMQGKHAEARQMLADIYSRFSEGFDTPDLHDARALLEQL